MGQGGSRVGLLFALAGAVGFSFKAILVKLAYRYGVDAETLLALRMVFALPFFLAMGVAAGHRTARRLDGRDWLWMAGLGFVGYYLASYLDFLGLNYISAGLERLILFLYPTLVIVLSALFLGKPVTRRAVAALGLCYLGIALALGHDLKIAGEAGTVLLGSVLVFGSALAYALYLMGNGEVVGRLGSMRVTALATSFACLFCIAQFLLLRPVAALAQPWPVYGLSLAMALFSTVAPVWLVSEAIRRLGAGPVSLTGTLGPVITIFLGWLLLDETLGASQIAGAALVIGGVLVMARR
ncbi:DMT family transporter [Pseudothauera rhizosphaerae]|uniref:DMT family transporter n=1 Tax=Pseudothauera rhizosphaerae TaxID=2565932 RepID=A0A4S4AY71_9RHOO|nr:DMT family transporter [Pseudothauera rhizosphaerae]THF65058.1 DMT family transporter [Pseudothauera rhizosphaerae]